MDGLLVIDKPVGPTSHDVVARVRRVLGQRRIGHTGTLDPLASGVLPLVVGRATRLARFLSSGDKSYEAVVQLGVTTATFDAEGAVVARSNASAPGSAPTREEIEEALGPFRGTFLQQPPRYSAKRIGGQRSYDLARANRSTDSPADPVLPARALVTGYAIDVMDVDGDTVTLHIRCSAGFYVRSLAHDFGERLGTGAHLAALRRTSCAGFTLDQALPLEIAEHNRAVAVAAVVPVADMLAHLSTVVLTEEGVRRAAQGRSIGPSELTGESREVTSSRATKVAIRLVDKHGQLVAIAEAGDAPGLLHPSVVLV